jgi:hypothetical protein
MSFTHPLEFQKFSNLHPLARKGLANPDFDHEFDESHDQSVNQLKKSQ